MRPRIAAHLPPLTVASGFRPGDRRSRDILHRQPEGGEHWWVRISVTGLSNKQVVSALARAAGIDVALVGDAGGRDRQAQAERWLSVPKSEVEHPKRLRNAGSHSKLRVLDIKEGRRPISPQEVVAVEWSLRLRGAAADDGYLRGRKILDHLRREGFPNYLSAPATNPAQARLGRLLAQGRALPPRAAQGGGKRRLLIAYQARLANILIAERTAAGELGLALPGDVVEVGCNRAPHQRAVEIVDDPMTVAKRIESWEAVAMAPLFGDGMAVAEDVAAEREFGLLEREGVAPKVFARLTGGRRAYRVRPAQGAIDLDGQDLALKAQLPANSFIDQFVAEFFNADASADDE